jgi:hypothetical protein
MFAHHLEAAVIGADSLTLDDISRACWKGFEEGVISEADAESISLAVEARRQALRGFERPKPAKPFLSQRREPRSPDRQKSLERRRRQVAPRDLPPQIANKFTVGEVAALSVIVGAIKRHGRCAMFIDQIAAIAGICRSTVKNAVREAAALGLISVTQRRRRGRLSDTNIIRVVDPGWLSWLKLNPKGQIFDHHAHKNSNLGRFHPSPAPQRARRYERGARPSSSYADTA